MKKTKIGMTLLGLVIALLVVGCSGAPTAPPATPTASASAKTVKAVGRIVAEGKVVPIRSAALSFQTAGIVAQVSVTLGDKVDAGKPLAQLDSKSLELQLAQADANLAAAQAKLSSLKRGPSADDLAAAQQNVTSAQAAYDNLMHPSANELAALKADVDKTKALVDQAQAAYDRIGGDSNPNAGMTPQRAQLQTALVDYQKAQALYNTKVNPSNAQVQQALAAIQNAKDQLSKLQPSPEDIAAAQANVNAAQAARDLAAEQVKNVQLVAPFAGVVTALDLRAGEYVTPGVPVVRVADTSAWQVETTDLTELNVVSVREGDAATVTLDALPGVDLAGKIERIQGYGENKQGDIVYKLVIKLDKQDERLRWNMTAKVSIEPQK